jgi:hypothetical protein
LDRVGVGSVQKARILETLADFGGQQGGSFTSSSAERR